MAAYIKEFARQKRKYLIKDPFVEPISQEIRWKNWMTIKPRLMVFMKEENHTEYQNLVDAAKKQIDDPTGKIFCPNSGVSLLNVSVGIINFFKLRF